MESFFYDGLGQPKSAYSTPEYRLGAEVGYTQSTADVSTTTTATVCSMTVEGDGVNTTWVEIHGWFDYATAGGAVGMWVQVDGTTVVDEAQTQQHPGTWLPMTTGYRLEPFTGTKTLTMKVASGGGATAYCRAGSMRPAYMRATRLKSGSAMANPTCKFGRKTAQSIPNVTSTAVQWNLAHFDSHAMNNNTASTKFYAPVSGVYNVSGCLHFAFNASGVRAALYGINGGTQVYMAHVPPLGTSGTVMPFTAQVDLMAGQYLEIFALQSSGGALNLESTNTNVAITYQGPIVQSQADGLKWHGPVRGIIVPNAAVGTTVTQPNFPGSTWSRMYGANLYKVGEYFVGATLVNHADGAQYIQIDHAGVYIFELMFTGQFPSCSEVGYGIATKVDADAGAPYLHAHHHQKPYSNSADFKVMNFQRYCNVGDLIAPIFYFNGATGTITHNNGPTSRAHFSFVRVSS